MSPASFRVLTASSRTGRASARMFDLSKSKLTPRRMILFFIGAGGGGGGGGGGAAAGAGGGAAKRCSMPSPAVTKRRFFELPRKARKPTASLKRPKAVNEVFFAISKPAPPPTL